MLSKLKTDPVLSAYQAIELPLVKNEAFARELNVVNQAKRAARKQVPPLAASSPDANETNFRQRIEAKALAAVNQVTTATEPLRHQLPGLNISTEVTEINELNEEFDRQLAAELSPGLTELDTQRQQLAQLDHELETFKQAHGIERAADYPDSHWLSLALLGSALLIETLLNGSLMADGSDFGLLGGASMALMISVLNIGCGFLAGWWLLRYKNHHHRPLAWRMLSGFLLVALFAVGFNGLIGHYREALLVSPDTVWQTLEQSLLAGRWLVTDFGSWLLMLIGLLFFTLAVYKGYQFDDEYPGYGRIARRRERQYDLLLDGRDAMLEQLEALHRAADTRLTKRFSDIERKKQQLFYSLAALEYQHELLLSYLRHLQKALSYVIRLYRETSTSARHGASPDYFSQSPQPLDVTLPENSQPQNLPDERAATGETVEQLGQQLPHIRSQLLLAKEHYQHKIDQACQLSG